MNGYRTAFEILGVSEEANDEAIRNRFADVQAEHGGGENDVPARIRDAYGQLAEEGSRQAYLEILRACREHRPLRLDSADVSKFLNTCTLWEIQTWKDRNRTDIHVYHVWQLADSEPVVVREQRQRERAAPPGIDPFRRGRRLRILAKWAAGIAVAAAAIWGWMAWTVWAEGRRQTAFADQMRAGISAAEKSLTAVEAHRTAILDEFQKLAGSSFPEATPQTPRSRELDLALIRHESVRKAWDQLLAQRDTICSVAEFRQRIGIATDRIGAGVLSPDDVEAVGALDRQLTERAQQVGAQRQNLRHIREMVEADHLERTLEQTGRNSP